MAKQTIKTAKVPLKKIGKTPVNLPFLLLLLAYGFVTVLTPNLQTLDSNGPKFMSLAILNLAISSRRTHPHYWKERPAIQLRQTPREVSLLFQPRWNAPD